jgi:hypothetical protein
VGCIGVHGTYQAAAAAASLNLLDRFYCSLLDSPGCLGGTLSRWIGPDRLANRRQPGIPSALTTENPWPFLRHQLNEAVRMGRPDGWFQACVDFDRWLAKRLCSSPSRVFYGVETCSELAIAEAKRLGMLCVVECPGVQPGFMARILEQDSGRRPVAYLAAPMTGRKLRTHALADVLVTQSEFQSSTYLAAGIPREKILECHTGIEPALFHAGDRPPAGSRPGPLRALYAGRVTRMKGIPWLLSAMRTCGRAVTLTVVGSVNASARALLANLPENVTVLPPVSRPELRRIYQEHDVLVLPSLVDSAPMVVMEAMACGLPVILTEHCGGRIPDPMWRIPIRSSEAITERLMQYAGDRTLLALDSERARTFSCSLHAEDFRRRLSDAFVGWCRLSLR